MTQNKQKIVYETLKAIREDESLLKGYASKKCKDCLGRGYIRLSLPKDSEKQYMCDCVKSRVKKEAGR